MKIRRIKLRLVPVILFTAFVMLLVRAYSYNMPIGGWPFMSVDNSTELWDAFCHIKVTAIVYISLLAAFTMAFLLITGQMKVKKTKIYIPMLIYAVMVIVSYYMSDYREIAWNGSMNRFEGTLTIMCYMFMLFYTINVVDDMQDAALVLAAAVVGVLIACIIGLTQLMGCDIFMTGIGKAIVSGGAQDIEIAGSFSPGQVYQTVYNMNYVGMYLALIVPALLLLFIKGCRIYTGHAASGDNSTGIVLGRQGDRKKVLTIVILSALLLIMIGLNVYGAGSVGGLVGILAAALMLVIMLLKKIWQKIAVMIVCAAGLIAIIAIGYMQGADSRKSIEYFETGDDYVLMSMNGNEITIKYDRADDSYSLWRPNGYPFAAYCLEGEEGQYQIDSSKFGGDLVVIPVNNDGEPYVILDVKDEQFLFKYGDDGAVFINPHGREIKLSRIDSTGFDGHLSALSGRGYIWSRTIPLVKEHIITGSGADTFMMVFPQDDYAGKYSSGSPLKTVIDKPHNMYLQMLVCTGGISSLAFLAIICMFMWRAFTIGQNNVLVSAVAAGVTGFMTAGLFNDSSVCTMPMFYGLLGIGIALCIQPMKDGNR